MYNYNMTTAISGELTLWPGLEGTEVPLASVAAADVRVAVIEVAVPFAAVLHARLVSVVPDATVEHNQHILSTTAPLWLDY